MPHGTPQTDRVCVFGRPGEGKSILGIWLLHEWPYQYVWVHDPTQQRVFSPYKKCSLHRPPPSHNCLLFLDEVDRLAPSSGFKAQWVDDCINLGRNFNVTWIAAARRPARVHRDITSYCTVAYLLAQTGARDLEYLVEEWGEKCLAVRDLELHEFLTVYPQNPSLAPTVGRVPQAFVDLILS